MNIINFLMNESKTNKKSFKMFMGNDTSLLMQYTDSGDFTR